MNSPGHSDNHDPPSPPTPSTTTPKEEIPPLLIFSDHLLTHHNLYLDRAMEMGSGFDTRRRKAATKEKRRSDEGKAIHPFANSSSLSPSSRHFKQPPFQSSSWHSMATPRRIQKSGSCSDGRLTDMTKLVEWPVEDSMPARPEVR